jgi:hypothetical protein
MCTAAVFVHLQSDSLGILQAGHSVVRTTCFDLHMQVHVTPCVFLTGLSRVLLCFMRACLAVYIRGIFDGVFFERFYFSFAGLKTTHYLCIAKPGGSRAVPKLGPVNVVCVRHLRTDRNLRGVCETIFVRC